MLNSIPQHLSSRACRGTEHKINLHHNLRRMIISWNKTIVWFLIFFSISCTPEKRFDQKNLTNEKTRNHPFLKGMYDDPYFPKHCVDKGRQVLINLCFRIESEKPKELGDLYKLTHDATKEFNDLQAYFINSGSEIETAAAENIALDIEFIAHAYGFNADIEELVSPWSW